MSIPDAEITSLSLNIVTSPVTSIEFILIKKKASVNRTSRIANAIIKR